MAFEADRRGTRPLRGGPGAMRTGDLPALQPLRRERDEPPRHPRDRLPAARRRRAPLGNTPPRRDFVYVDDAADALVALTRCGALGKRRQRRHRRVALGRRRDRDDRVAHGRELRVVTDHSGGGRRTARTSSAAVRSCVRSCRLHCPRRSATGSERCSSKRGCSRDDPTRRASAPKRPARSTRA